MCGIPCFHIVYILSSNVYCRGHKLQVKLSYNPDKYIH